MTKASNTKHTAEKGVIQASLKYLDNNHGPLNYVASEGGGDVTQHEGHYSMRNVSIYNGRGRSFNLDNEGFQLVDNISTVTDFYSDTQIKNIYEQDVNALVLKYTGANRVEIFDHTIRSSSIDIQRRRNIREPASLVHNDYSERSGVQRLKDYFHETPEVAEKLLKHRFAIVNVWRSINGMVSSSAIGLCDASTVAPEDLVPVTRKAKDRIGELQQAVYRPSHQWYYFPEMQPDESLLIKTYDSAKDGRARFTIHTAFDMPKAENAKPRESIETRCFAFF